MGLDQYAYVSFERGERHRWNSTARFNNKTGEIESQHKRPHEIAYWRKHNRLQEWMYTLWDEKGKPYSTDDPIWGKIFNGIELELEWSDIHRLENDILNCENGFYESYYYRENDLQFCLDAKEQLFLYRKRVFYNSSW